MALGAARTVLINLRKRDDRRLAAAAELARLSETGFDGEYELMLRDPPADAAGFPTVGARGCFESHLDGLKKGLEFSNLLILEDDILFDFDIAKTAAAAFAGQTAPWDIFYGGYESPPGVSMPEGKGLLTVDPNLPLRQTHCVGFSGAVIPALISYLEEIKARPPGDARGGPSDLGEPGSPARILLGAAPVHGFADAAYLGSLVGH